MELRKHGQSKGMLKICGITEMGDLIGDYFQNVTEFFKQYSSSCKITRINGKMANEICEECECAISFGDPCYKWNDDVFTCNVCGGNGEDHLPIILGYIDSSDPEKEYKNGGKTKQHNRTDAEGQDESSNRSSQKEDQSGFVRV